LMKKMAIEAIYRRPNTSKPAPGHKIYPYLLRRLPIVRPNQVCPIKPDLMKRVADVLECLPVDLLTLEAGGLSDEEREIINLMRDLPEANRLLIVAGVESQRRFIEPKN